MLSAISLGKTSLRSTTLVCLALSLAAIPALAQRGGTGSRNATPVDVTIRVRLENDRPVGEQLRVQVLSHSATVSESFTDDTGEMHVMLLPGFYGVRVSGNTIEDSSDYTFVITPGEMAEQEYVHVRPREGGPATLNGTIDAREANVPDKARKEYDKGVEAAAKKDTAKAREHLLKAVEIYPNFASALDTLGIFAMQAGQRAEGEAYFQKAIAVNDKFAPAYMDLARVRLMQQRNKDAEDLIKKALITQPLNNQVLTMLARVELLNGEYDQALADAQKVHGQPHEKFGLVHLVAAEAYERKKMYQQALDEYRTFLKEEPNSPTKPKVEQAIAMMQQKVAAQPQ